MREQSTNKTWQVKCKQKNKSYRRMEVCLAKGDNKKLFKELKSRNTGRKLVGPLDDQHVKRTVTDDEARVAKISEDLGQILWQISQKS